MAKLERRLRRATSPLLSFAADITSQGGEDGILQEIFRVIDTGAPKYCVDVGAWDGKWLSNTYSLLKDQNETSQWSGLLIEANAERSNSCQEMYKDNLSVQCVCTLVSLEGENTLEKLLSRYHVPSDFDFLCIDIDGADYHLWARLSTSIFRPKVVCIEFNPTIPNSVFFVQESSTLVHQGSSLLALSELGQSIGYSLLVTTTFNATFVLDEYLHLFPAYDRSIDALHVPTMTTEVFQTYDGELIFTGARKLMWHKLALNPEKLQILKRNERKYPYAPPSVDHVIALYEALSYLSSADLLSSFSEVQLEEYSSKVMANLTYCLGQRHLQGIFEKSLYVFCSILERLLLQRSTDGAIFANLVLHNVISLAGGLLGKAEDFINTDNLNDGEAFLRLASDMMVLFMGKFQGLVGVDIRPLQAIHRRVVMHKCTIYRRLDKVFACRFELESLENAESENFDDSILCFVRKERRKLEAKQLLFLSS